MFLKKSYPFLIKKSMYDISESSYSKPFGLMCKGKLQILHLSFSQLIGLFNLYHALIFGSIAKFLYIIFNFYTKPL